MFFKDSLWHEGEIAHVEEIVVHEPDEWGRGGPESSAVLMGPESLDAFAERAQEAFAIGVVMEDRPPLVARAVT